MFGTCICRRVLFSICQNIPSADCFDVMFATLLRSEFLYWCIWRVSWYGKISKASWSFFTPLLMFWILVGLTYVFKNELLFTHSFSVSIKLLWYFLVRDGHHDRGRFDGKYCQVWYSVMLCTELGAFPYLHWLRFSSAVPYVVLVTVLYGLLSSDTIVYFAKFKDLQPCLPFQ